MREWKEKERSEHKNVNSRISLLILTTKSDGIRYEFLASGLVDDLKFEAYQSWSDGWKILHDQDYTGAQKSAIRRAIKKC